MGSAHNILVFHCDLLNARISRCGTEIRILSRSLEDMFLKVDGKAVAYNDLQKVFFSAFLMQHACLLCGTISNDLKLQPIIIAARCLIGNGSKIYLLFASGKCKDKIKTIAKKICGQKK